MFEETKKELKWYKVKGHKGLIFEKYDELLAKIGNLLMSLKLILLVLINQ